MRPYKPRKFDPSISAVSPIIQIWRLLQEVSKADAEALKKRKLVTLETWKTYRLQKGPQFALEKKKAATDLTHDMLQRHAPCMAPAGCECSLKECDGQI